MVSINVYFCFHLFFHVSRSASVYNVYLKNKLVSSATRFDRSKTDLSAGGPLHYRRPSIGSNESEPESKLNSLSTQFSRLTSSKASKSKSSNQKHLFYFLFFFETPLTSEIQTNNILCRVVVVYFDLISKLKGKKLN